MILAIDSLQAFIDPFFSSGVHLAFTGGLSAALTIAASIRGLTSEEDAQRWHTSKVGSSYTRHVNSVTRAITINVMNDIGSFSSSLGPTNRFAVRPCQS